MYAIEDFFNRNVQKQMYKGIEVTLKAEAHNTCALALSVYTEILGGFVRGTHDPYQGSKNFNAFLQYFGDYYQTLSQKNDIYSIIRSGLVHEGEPKGEFMIVISGKLEKRHGIEFIKLQKNRIHVNFSLREYFQEFKDAVQKYRNELEEAYSIHQKSSCKPLEANQTNYQKLRLLEDFLKARNRKYEKCF